MTLKNNVKIVDFNNTLFYTIDENINFVYSALQIIQYAYTSGGTLILMLNSRLVSTTMKQITF